MAVIFLLNYRVDELMEQVFKKILEDRSIKQFLDVATGGGGNIFQVLPFLSEGCEVVGIDVSDTCFEKIYDRTQKKIDLKLQRMSSESLDFASESFDLVAISNSLHHIECLELSFDEILRVLRPGGVLLVNEMYQDFGSKSQNMHTKLHHWWVEVDRASGIPHQETYKKSQIMDMFENREWASLCFEDYKDLGADPFNSEILDQLEKICLNYADKARDHADYSQLKAKGVRLVNELLKVGFHSANQLIVVAQK